jgi:hypothetical protein
VSYRSFLLSDLQIETSRDTYFMSQLGGRDYVGTISPLFATHFSYKVSWRDLQKLTSRTGFGGEMNGSWLSVGSRCSA